MTTTPIPNPPITTANPKWTVIPATEAPFSSPAASDWAVRANFTPDDLSDKGLLWLINAVVFHPRGMALAVQPAPDTGESLFVVFATNGTEALTFSPEVADAKYVAVETLLKQLNNVRSAETTRRKTATTATTTK